MKNLFFLMLLVFGISTASAQTARVQIIHNSADAAAAEVDIYLDGAIAIEDVAFRTATPFIDLPADVNIGHFPKLLSGLIGVGEARVGCAVM